MAMESICSDHAALPISAKTVRSPWLHSIAFAVGFPQRCEGTDKAPTRIHPCGSAIRAEDESQFLSGFELQEPKVLAQRGCLGSLPSGGQRKGLGERRYYV